MNVNHQLSGLHFSNTVHISTVYNRVQVELRESRPHKNESLFGLKWLTHEYVRHHVLHHQMLDALAIVTLAKILFVMPI